MLFAPKGLFSPDRIEHPAVSEVKRLQQPVQISLLIDSNNKAIHGDDFPFLQFNVKNRYCFTTLEHLELNWSIVSDSEGHLLSNSISYINEGSLTLPLVEFNKISSLQQTLRITLKLTLKNETIWASKGHTIFQEQYCIFEPEIESKGHDLAFKNGKMKSREDDSFIAVSINGVDVVCIDKNTGYLSQYSSPRGDVIISKSNNPLGLNFTRASTDNDRGGIEMLFIMMYNSWVLKAAEFFFGLDGFSHDYHWTRLGLSASNEPLHECTNISMSSLRTKKMEETILVKAYCVTKSNERNSKELFQSIITYAIFPNGQVKVSYQISPSTFVKDIPSLGRVGLKAMIEPPFSNIEYLGRGPFENYPDRKSASDIGRW